MKGITKIQVVMLTLVLIVAVVAAATVYYLTLPKEKTEILIGAAVSRTGGYAAHGKKISEGYNLWVKLVNEGGGLLGKPVRLIEYDDESDPTTTKQLYEKLITYDNVDLLLGPYSSSCGFSAAPVAEKYKMVMMQPMNNAMQLYNQTDWEYQFLCWPLGSTDSNFIPHWEVISTLSPEVRPRTVAYVNSADVYPRSMAEGAIKNIEQQFSEYFELVYHEEIPKGATDVTAVISKVKEVNAEIFMVIGFLPEETLILNTAAQLGYNPKVIISGTGGAKEFYEVLGALAEDVMIHVPFSTKLESEATTEFTDKFSAEYGKIPEYYHAMAFGACEILEAAVKSVGSIDQTAIRDWLRIHEVQTPYGVWKVDEQLLAQGIRHIPEIFGYSGQWHEGEIEIIYPLEAATREFVFPRPPH